MPFLTSLSNSSSGGVSAATPAKLTTVNDISNTTGAVDYYGSAGSISISYFAVGAPRHTSGIYTNTGIAYLYRKINGELLQTFTDPNPNVNYPSNFGAAVSVTEEYVAIAATGTSVGGTVYVYDVNTYETVRILFNPNYNSGDTTPIGDQFGKKIEIVGDYIIVSAPNDDISASETNAGIVYIFNISTGNLIKTITNPATVRTGGEFGYDIDVFEDHLIVGSPYANSNRGAAYIYETQSGDWSDTALVRTLDNLSDSAITSGSNSYFGTSVAIEGDLCVVGARDATGNIGESYAGKVYVYNVTNGSLKYSLYNPKTLGNASFNFGTKVALSDEVLIVQAFGYVTTQQYSGCIFIYERTRGELLESLYSDGTLDNNTRYAVDTLEISGEYILISERSDLASDSAKVIVYNYVPAKLAGANLPVNYTLAATREPVAEGLSFTVYLSTRNVPVGSSVPYTISGVTAADIGRTTLRGNFIVSEDQSASTLINISTDSIVEGDEIFTLSIDNSTESISVTITDTTENVGEALFIDGGTYYWKCPPGVTEVCVVCIGAGGDGYYAGGGATTIWRGGGSGGNLMWKNNISVVPGTYYKVEVGSGGIPPNVWAWYTGMVTLDQDGPEVANLPYKDSSFNGNVVFASGGRRGDYTTDRATTPINISPNVNQGGGTGGNGASSPSSNGNSGGGGGAAGYGDGNNFGHGYDGDNSNGTVQGPANFVGAGAGGGFNRTAGAGVGPYGNQNYPTGAPWNGGRLTYSIPTPAGGWRYGSPYKGSASYHMQGGAFGGGGTAYGFGGAGCVRIMWGQGRSFPFNAEYVETNNYAIRIRESYRDYINIITDTYKRYSWSTDLYPVLRDEVKHGTNMSIASNGIFIMGSNDYNGYYREVVNFGRLDYTGVLSTDRIATRKLWFQRPIVPNTNASDSKEAFGESVYTDGVNAIIGAPEFNFNDPGNIKYRVGRFYIVSMASTSFTLRYVSEPEGFPIGDEKHASSVAISGKCAASAAGGIVDGELGVVNIYSSSHTYWNGTVTRSRISRPSDLPEQAYFGTTLAMSGDYLLVGADSGKLYVYETSQTSTNHTLLHTISIGYDITVSSISIYGDMIVVGVPEYNLAQIYNVVTGELLAILQNPDINPNATGDSFGYSVSVGSKYIVIGAPYEDSLSATDSGAIYIFDKSTFQIVSSIVNSNDQRTSYGLFGSAVANYGNCVLGTRPGRSFDINTNFHNWYIYDIYVPN